MRRPALAWPTWLTRRSGDAGALLVAMEGAGSYGAKLREQLAVHALRMVEAHTPSRAQRRSRGKSDPLDAVRAAEAALSLPVDRLTEPKTGELIPA